MIKDIKVLWYAIIIVVIIRVCTFVVVIYLKNILAMEK